MLAIIFSSLFSLLGFAEEATSASKVEAKFSSPTLSRKDLYAGEALWQIYKLSKKEHLSKKLLTQARLKAADSAPFALFAPWVKTLEDLTEKKTSEDVISYCLELKKTVPEKPHLLRYLYRHSIKLCRLSALEMFAREVDKDRPLSEANYNFISEEINSYLKKDYQEKFSYFLQTISSHPESLRKISTLITTHSLKSQLLPSKKLISDMHFDEKITQLVQANGLPGDHTQIFYAEFRKMIDASYDLMDTENQGKKIKESYSQIRHYFEQNKDYMPLNFCLERIANLGKAFYRYGEKDLARKVFQYVIDKNHPEIREDALFSLLWTWVIENNNDEAISIIKKFKLDDQFSEINDSRLKFWIAYVFRNAGKTDQAIDYWKEMIEKNPLSYYSIFAIKYIRDVNPEHELLHYYPKKLAESSTNPLIEKTAFTPQGTEALHRLKAWATLEANIFTKKEVRGFKLESKDLLSSSAPSISSDDFIKHANYLIAAILSEGQNYLEGFKFIYKQLEKDKINFDLATLELLYPKPFIEIVEKRIDKKSSIDPLMVLSLIRQESVFNPRATSRVGAKGLMQLMPFTAKRFRRAVKNHQLVRPETNIELGTDYLKNLYKRYDGNWVYILSAYNAGESRVEKWRKTHLDESLPMVMNIEMIPFLETRTYVKLIFRNVYFYKLLKDQKALDTIEKNKIFDVALGFKH